MARRPSKHLRSPRPLLAGGFQQRESKQGVEFIVRTVAAHQALKHYRCPGCQHAVVPGVAHVLAWPVSAPLGIDTGLEARRHWHSHCWRSQP